uniref:Integrase_H2C2 domain-containing protein n=1 Tax=Anopheles funestus TaxID=62324 RepID=A0A4Y0BI96_ANOFN
MPLQQYEYEKAKPALLKMAQVDCFIYEMTILMKNKDRPTDRWISFEKSSALYKLSPMLEEYGIIRMEGRMERAEFLPFSLIFPVILPSDHVVTRLIVRHHHEKSGHGYREAVKNELRQLYYILHLDATVRKEATACVWCKVRRNHPDVPRMAPLPVQRLTPNLRPFSFTGVDYIGPFNVTIGRRTEKRWIVLFTCLVVRGLSTRSCHGLSTRSCLMALRRFICRRGWPVEFLSDNETNFRGASREITEAVETIQGECADQFTNARTKRSFNPPSHPTWEGCGNVW